LGRGIEVLSYPHKTARQCPGVAEGMGATPHQQRTQASPAHGEDRDVDRDRDRRKLARVIGREKLGLTLVHGGIILKLTCFTTQSESRWRSSRSLRGGKCVG